VNLLSETTGVQGRSLTIDCTPSSGRPQPTIAWLRVGAPVTPDSRVSVSSQGSLVFNQLFSTDASTYTCLASNFLGNSSSSTNLIVQGMIKITKSSIDSLLLHRENHTVNVHGNLK